MVVDGPYHEMLRDDRAAWQAASDLLERLLGIVAMIAWVCHTNDGPLAF